MAYYVERSKNLLKIKGRTQATYGGNGPNTSIRNFSEDYYYVGLTGNNYWYYWNVESFSVEENKVQIKATSKGYGVCFPLKCKPNTKYTCSYIAAGGYIAVGFYTENGEYIDYLDQHGINNNGGWFITPANCYWLTICFRNEDLTKETTYTDIMLNEGETALPYEPYGARIFIGNNLFNINGEYQKDGQYSMVYVDGGKLITPEVGGGASSYAIFQKLYPAGTYTISMDVETDDTDSENYRIFTTTANNVGAYNSYYNAWYVDSNKANPITFTTSEPFKIGIVFTGKAGSYKAYYNIMLNEGTTALPYEPYKAEPYKKVRVAYYNGKRIFLDRTRFGMSAASTLASLGKFRLSDLSRMKLR